MLHDYKVIYQGLQNNIVVTRWTCTEADIRNAANLFERLMRAQVYQITRMEVDIREKV